MRGGISIRWLARLSGTSSLKGLCGLQAELLARCVRFDTVVQLAATCC